MKAEELNTLMSDVIGRLDRSGCEYFVSVLVPDEEATLGSASINVNDVSAAAEFIAQSIRQGGDYGQRMLALFGAVIYNLKTGRQLSGDSNDALEEAKEQQPPRRSFHL